MNDRNEGREHEGYPFVFGEGTIKAVKDALFVAYFSRAGRRYRFWWGDTTTGKAWDQEWDVLGSVGRSMGPRHIPILIHNGRSMGGGAISTGSIVRMVDTHGRYELYRHPKFHTSVYQTCAPTGDGYQSAVMSDGEMAAQFKSRDGANKWIAFMKGERFSK